MAKVVPIRVYIEPLCDRKEVRIFQRFRGGQYSVSKRSAYEAALRMAGNMTCDCERCNELALGDEPDDAA
jgi:hypothetical protein